MASSELLKIPKRPIYIKYPADDHDIAILTVNNKFYGFYELSNENNLYSIQYDKSTVMQHDDDYKTAIEYVVSENFIEKDNYSKGVHRELLKQRSSSIIKELEIAINNPKSNGDLDKTNSSEQEEITSILKNNNITYSFKNKEKHLLTNNNNSYAYLLKQLITGKSYISDKYVKRDETLNEIAVLLKTELGLKQELEIKGIYLEKTINDLYIKTEFNTMKKISFEKLYETVLKLLHGTDNLTHKMETNFKRKDLKDILDYIPSDRRYYNILTLNNGLYDLEKHEFLDYRKIIEIFGKPILTHKTVPYNYNKNAEGKQIKEILRYAFDKYNCEYDPEITEIKGFYEIGGYSLRSGNPEQKIAFMFGVANSSKSVLNNLITAIHGHKVSSLPLEKFNDRFGTSALLNVQLNTIRDINNAKIKNNSMIKISSGNEPLLMEQKGKPHGIIPAIEVPFSIASGNVLLKFENPEVAILRRLLHLEFKNRVPTAIKIDENNNVIEWNKDDLWVIEELESKKSELCMEFTIPYVIKDIDKIIINDNDEMEFLLYQFLEHDKTRITKNNHNFSIEKSHDDILKDLELYSNPVETLLTKIIEYDETIKEDVGIAANELYELLREQAKINHVDMPKSSRSLGKKVKPSIISIFDLEKNYNTKNNRSKLNRNNEVETCKPTRIYPKIQYKQLITNKKHN